MVHEREFQRGLDPRANPRAPGQGDPMDTLREMLLHPRLGVNNRAASIVNYGADNFVRQWAARVRLRWENNCFPPGLTEQQAWRTYGLDYIELFAPATRAGRPVEASIVFPIEFRLI